MDGIGEDVRGRIIAAAARLGYQPNLAARALASASKPILLAVRDLTDPIVASVTAAIERILMERRHHALTSSGSEGSVRRLRTLGLGGVVFLGAEPRQEEVEALGGIPWLSVTDEEAAPGIQVTFGRAQGLDLAYRYLQEVGHRGITLITSHRTDVPQRTQPLDPRLAAASVPVGEPGEVKLVLKRLLESESPPTAIVCDTDLMALAGLRYCAMEGIQVPHRLSVVGFGDAPFARLSYPALTTVRRDFRGAAVGIVDTLMELMAGRESVSKSIPVKLVLRESSRTLL
jgi:LacI family transcriptional regulator